VYELVDTIAPLDQLEADHIADTLRWLKATDDVFRRSKPATPARHLVSYVVLLDRPHREILLVDHVSAGLLLPPGGHVELDEHPAATARRECQEELGVEARLAENGDPVFLTVTETAGLSAGHTDVSLWFIADGSRGDTLTLHETEFRDARWWSLEDVAAVDERRFDPHLDRFLAKAFSTREQPQNPT
jgi:8-oxo-dGTP diphosphatase